MSPRRAEYLRIEDQRLDKPIIKQLRTWLNFDDDPARTSEKDDRTCPARSTIFHFCAERGWKKIRTQNLMPTLTAMSFSGTFKIQSRSQPLNKSRSSSIFFKARTNCGLCLAYLMNVPVPFLHIYLVTFAKCLRILLAFAFNNRTLWMNRSSLSYCPVLSTLKMK